MKDQTVQNAIDSNLVEALDKNGVVLPSSIYAVLATIEGSREGANWHWVVSLDSGQCAYITGGCDYTGWDCRFGCEVFVESTLEGVLFQVPEAFREELTRNLGKARIVRWSTKSGVFSDLPDEPKREILPTEPVVQCLNCNKDFVWWVHPVQLCDDCVDLE